MNANNPRPEPRDAAGTATHNTTRNAELTDLTVAGLDRMLRIADRLERNGMPESAAHLRIAVGSMPDATAVAIAEADYVATSADLERSCIILTLHTDGVETLNAVHCPGMVVSFGGDVA